MRNYRARGVTPDGKPIFAEAHEHEVVAAWLTMHGIFFIHVPNEGKRSWQTGKQLKRMGMVKGCPDFLIFDGVPFTVGQDFVVNRPTALELKAVDGKVPTAEQIAFLSHLRQRGWVADWCRGSEAAIKWLESLGYGGQQ